MVFDDKPATLDRLDTEPIIWLTTVRQNGQPQTSPVWFLRQGNDLLIYSLPETARVDNIRSNPLVALNLDGNKLGGAIVTIEGTARIADELPAASDMPEYVAKYSSFMERNGWTPEVFAARYSKAIVVTMRRGRSW